MVPNDFLFSNSWTNGLEFSKVDGSKKSDYTNIVLESLIRGVTVPFLPYSAIKDPSILKGMTNSSIPHPESTVERPITEKFYLYGNKSFTVSINN